MPSVSQRPPAFPSHLPTADLVVLDFDLLQKNDPAETERMFVTCQKKGFFYLKNNNVNTDAAFKFGKNLFEIPTAEKEKYLMGDGVNYLGYKRVGEFIVDSKGTPDSQETWNVHSVVNNLTLVFKR
jgi:isopenicillin N synthase-like dioxygenase